uniref:G_PROTEIN_RECEP_F1_2 domain-containing protein n=1 Tax=Rhabditophanes sp. KR3021 TaxID=114890 RepID=A0AC35TZ00_9BILA
MIIIISLLLNIELINRSEEYNKHIDPQIIYHTNLVTGTIDDSITSQSKSVSMIVDLKMVSFLVPGFVFLLLPVIAIIITLMKYRKFMTNNQSKLSKETLKLNKEFFKMLCLQALTPAFAQFIPSSFLVILIIGLILRMEIKTLGSWVVILSSFVPILNSIIFLTFLSKSRSILKQRYEYMFSLLFKKKTTHITLLQ